MTGRCVKAGAALLGVLALVLTGAASAASPDVAAMNLQVADVPGATLISERAVTEKGYTAAYVRTFGFAAPKGSARLVLVESETRLASTVAFATSDMTLAQQAMRSALGRKAFIAAVARGAKVAPKLVVLGRVRAVGGYDQGFTVPVSFPVKTRRAYESLVFLRLDRVVVFMLGVGLRPTGPAATAPYVTALAGHIGTALAPVAVTPPTITGTAQQAQTLTASPGTWSAADAVIAYQWQRCDAAGMNCVAIPGATTQTYAVTPADVGATLVVSVTASNRFGAPVGASAATQVVM
jgi:hypothetical protein